MGTSEYTTAELLEALSASSGLFRDISDRICGERKSQYADRLDAIAEIVKASEVKPLSAWHEDMGDVLWWRLPIEEPPYVGSPLDCEWEERNYDKYYTHFTTIVIPDEPKEGDK